MVFLIQIYNTLYQTFQMDPTNRRCTPVILSNLRKQGALLYIVAIVVVTTMTLVHFMDITCYILRGSIQIKNNTTNPRDEQSTSLITLKYRNRTKDIKRESYDKNKLMKFSEKKYYSTTDNISIKQVMSTVSSNIKLSLLRISATEQLIIELETLLILKSSKVHVLGK